MYTIAIHLVSQSAALPSPHCTAATGEHSTQPQTVSIVSSEPVTAADDQSAAEHFHTSATK
jgi:hypothetical protein